MKNSSNFHIHGYENSALDNVIRARLANGQVIAFTLTYSGVEGRFQARKLRLPRRLSKIQDVSTLILFLRNNRIRLIDRRIILGDIPATTTCTTVIETSPPIPTEIQHQFKPILDS